MFNRILLRGSLLVLLGLFVAIYFEPTGSTYAINYDQKTGMPISLSGDEFVIVRDTALSDPKVQELIGGRNYIISDCCGFVQNGPSAPWQPVINLSVAGKLQIAATVDLDSRKVVGIESAPFIQQKIPREDITKAEKIVSQSSSSSEGDSGSGTPMLAVNNSTMLPLMAVVGIVFGGAAVGLFYYVTKRNGLAAH